MGGAASYKLRLVFKYSNSYWKVYRRHKEFLVWGGEKLKGVTLQDFSMEEFFMGEENFNKRGAGFSRTIKKIMKNKYEKCFHLRLRSSVKT